MFLRTTLLPLLSLFFVAGTLTAQARQTDCANPTAAADLNINAVRARITNSGNLWNDSGAGAYEVTANDASPNLNPVAAIYTGSLWIGGVDPGGGLKVAAQQYETNRFDFYPGPLTDEGITEADQCVQWDRLFPILQEDVRNFISDYDAQNPPVAGQIIANIAGWPGKGNPLFEAVNGFPLPNDTEEYAPFQDVNEDGIYNPLDGDYPLFCGDQAIWCIFNDAGGPHASSNTPAAVQAEIHLLAYAFAANDSLLHRTTFYDYKIINRGQENVMDFYAGHWIDSDLGCFQNDLNNSSPENNLFYVYNDTSVEPEICDGVAGYGNTSPVNIFQVVRSTAATAQVEGGPLMSSFVSTYNQGVGGPLPAVAQQPATAVEYYNQLTGLWPNGTPQTRGGVGYETGGEATRFAFDGGMVNDEPWQHCTSASGATDTRQTYSTGPYNLAPGDAAGFTLAITTVFGIDYPTDICPDASQVLSAAGFIKDFYDGNCSPSVLTSTRTPQSPESIGLEVFPNPTAGQLSFRVPEGVEIKRIEVLDMSGRQLTTSVGTTNDLGIDLKAVGLPAGVYVYRLQTTDGVMVTGRVVLME